MGKLQQWARGRKGRSMDLYEYALKLPLGSVERTNVMLDALFVMTCEVNKHAGWLEFNDHTRMVQGK